MGKLTHNDVVQLLEQRRTTVFGNLHTEMETDEEFIQATDQWAADLMSPYMRAFPKDFKPRAVGLARLAMLAMANNLMNSETPKVEVMIDRGSGVTGYEDTAAMMQTWGVAFLHAYRPQLWMAAKHVGGLGTAWVYYGVDKDKYPKEPDTGDEEAWQQWEAERRKVKVVDLRVIHPRRVYWDDAHEEPQDVLFEEEISPAAAAVAYPDHDWTITDSERKTLKRVIYCSPTQYGVWVDNVPVTVGPNVGEDGMADNPYGEMWCSYAFSGLGMPAFDGDLVHEVQGNVRQGRGVIASALVAFNRLEVLGVTGAMPGRDFKGGASVDRDEVMKNYRVGPLAMNDMGGESLAEAVQVEVQPVVDMPQFTRDQSVLIEQYLNLTYGNDFLRGLPTVDNATVNAQNIDLAQRVYGAAVASFDAMCADILTKVFGFIRDSMESVQDLFLPDGKADGGHVRLTPSRIPKRGYRVKVDMTPPSMSERQASLENDRVLKQELGFDASWLAKRQGIENFDEERQKGDERKLIEATADAAATVINEYITQKLPERLGIVRREEVADGVVESDPAVAEQAQQEQEAAMMEQQAMMQPAGPRYRLPVGA